MDVVAVIDLGVRALAFAGVVVAGGIAATHWAVRHGHLNTFGPVAKTVRSLGDPLLKPVEKGLVRRGGNPQDATLWLLGIAIVGGLLLVTITRWIEGFVLGLLRLAGAPAVVWLQVAIDWGFGLLILALFVRVISTWVGLSPYTNRAVRLCYRLTDWLIRPIQRLLPQHGRIDWSPLVAYLALFIGRELLAALLR